MAQLWKWIIIYWVICIGILYAVPIHYFDLIPTPWYGATSGYRMTAAVLIAVTLVTLIRLPFKMRLSAFVAGSTAMMATLFISSQIVFTFNRAIGMGIFIFSLFLGFLSFKAGSLYGEEISATKDSSKVHMSQAAELLGVYVAMMIRLLGSKVLRDYWAILQKIWRDLKPFIDQLIRDISQYIDGIIGKIF